MKSSKSGTRLQMNMVVTLLGLPGTYTVHQYLKGPHLPKYFDTNSGADNLTTSSLPLKYVPRRGLLTVF